MHESSVDTTIWSSRLARPLRELARQVGALALTAKDCDRPSLPLNGYAVALARRIELLEILSDACTPELGGGEQLVATTLETRIEQLRAQQDECRQTLHRAILPGLSGIGADRVTRRLDDAILRLDILLGALDPLFGEDLDGEASDDPRDLDAEL